jgi:cytochrome P450
MLTMAGADTLVASLTYTFWELARPENHAALDRLQAELQSAAFTDDGLPCSYLDIDALPWLESCLREGLRIHTPSGHMQLRVVPHEGAVIAGHWMPGNVWHT